MKTDYRGLVQLHVGQSFGLLTLLGLAPGESRATMASVRCQCGTEKALAASDLFRADKRRVISCGCLRRRGCSTHGEARRGRRTPEYSAWKDMRKRCSNPASKSYSDYGGRGIFVVERWNSFENFLADMGRKPALHSIERRDNDGPYSPENCYWGTATQQARNRRSSLLITVQGVTKSLAEWAADADVPYKAAWSKHRVGKFVPVIELAIIGRRMR